MALPHLFHFMLPGFFSSRAAARTTLAAAFLAHLATPLHAGQQDAGGLGKALEGLPPEVRGSVRLTPQNPWLPAAAADDPLSLALRLALQISGDNEVRNRHLHQCGRQALAQGRLDTAREIAARVTDYRAALLLLDLASAADAAGEKEKARELFETASGMTRLVKPWQADLLLARLIVEGARQERDSAAASAWWDGIKNPENRLTATAGLILLQSTTRDSFDLPALRSAVAALGRARPLPELLEIARQLFRQALERLGSGDARQAELARQRVDAACEVLALSNVARAELLVETASEFFKAGHEEISKRLFQLAEKNLGAPHEEHMRLVWRVLHLWHLRGSAAEMSGLVDAAEERLRQMEPMHLPFGLAWLAAASELAGQREKAAAMLEEAAAAARANPNPRTGFAGAVEICLCHARTGRALPENVYKMLAEMAGLPVVKGE